MIVDDETIDKLAKLSSLEIPSDKKENLKRELSEIINFVDNLKELDVSQYEATFTTVEGGTPLREDIAIQDLELAAHILNNAPQSQDGFFIVPKIIE